MPLSLKRLVLSAFLMAAGPALAAASPTRAIELMGRGVQIYTCTAGAAGATWKLKAPDAILVDAGGRVVGHHFAGPTWQATDGSKVVGAPIAVNASPARGSVAWLILRAADTMGNGLFGQVIYIVRSRTIGGAAPVTGCDSRHVGGETRIPYSASYTFFSSAQ